MGSVPQGFHDAPVCFAMKAYVSAASASTCDEISGEREEIARKFHVTQRRPIDVERTYIAQREGGEDREARQTSKDGGRKECATTSTGRSAVDSHTQDWGRYTLHLLYLNATTGSRLKNRTLCSLSHLCRRLAAPVPAVSIYPDQQRFLPRPGPNGVLQLSDVLEAVQRADPVIVVTLYR